MPSGRHRQDLVSSFDSDEHVEIEVDRASRLLRAPCERERAAEGVVDVRRAEVRVNRDHLVGQADWPSDSCHSLTVETAGTAGAASVAPGTSPRARAPAAARRLSPRALRRSSRVARRGRCRPQNLRLGGCGRACRLAERRVPPRRPPTSRARCRPARRAPAATSQPWLEPDEESARRPLPQRIKCGIRSDTRSTGREDPISGRLSSPLREPVTPHDVLDPSATTSATFTATASGAMLPM